MSSALWPPKAPAGRQHAHISALLWPGELAGNLRPMHRMLTEWMVEARQHMEGLAHAIASQGG
jgi:hypothetical protein